MRKRFTLLRNDETRRGLRTLFLVLPAVLLLLGLVHLFTLPGSIGLTNAVSVWAIAIVVLLARFGFLDLQSNPGWAVPTGTLVALLLIGAAWWLLVTAGQPLHALYLGIILLGTGFFIVSTPALTVCLFAVAAASTSAVILNGSAEEWTHAIIGLVLAAFLAAVFLSVRARSVKWLYEVRRRGEMQKISMERSFNLARDLETQSRALAESAFEGIIIHKEGQVIDLNEAACQLIGESRSNVIDRQLSEFLDQDQLEKYRAQLQNLISNQGITVESRWRLRDGRVIEVEARSRKIPYLQGEAEVLVIRDVTSERQVQREMQAILNQLENILESAGEGIYGLDREGRILFVNRAAADLNGVDHDEMIGRQAHDLFHHSTKDTEPYPASRCPIMRTAREGGVVEVNDEVFWRSDGTCYPVFYVASPLMEGDRVTGAVVVFQDKSHQAEIDKMKDELISVVGHELKTPLASIHGSLRLIEGLSKGDLPDNVVSLLQIATRNTERLARLVNDLLDVERMDAGRLELDKSRVSAMEMVQDAVLQMRGFAETHGVRVDVDGKDVVFRADRDRVMQALTNLISNAIKFSPESGIVRVGVERQRDHVRFEVKDHGPGIAKEKMDRLFQRFSQLDTSDSRSKGGSGLGLVITRSIVEAHGGKVGLDSTPGEGSTFFILLPLRGDEGASKGGNGRT